MTNDIDKKAIGVRIKNIRQEKGMTLEEFGKLFGAGKGLVSRWENGLSIPNPERVKAIAKIGDTTVQNLLSGTASAYLKSSIDSKLEELSKDDLYIHNLLTTSEFEDLYRQLLFEVDTESYARILDTYGTDYLDRISNKFIDAIKLSSNMRNDFEAFTIFNIRFHNFRDIIEDVYGITNDKSGFQPLLTNKELNIEYYYKLLPFLDALDDALGTIFSELAEIEGDRLRILKENLTNSKISEDVE
ncbi:TPA: helix-turn-helix domain-containing protein [Streptococcus suis]